MYVVPDTAETEIDAVVIEFFAGCAYLRTPQFLRETLPTPRAARRRCWWMVAPRRHHLRADSKMPRLTHLSNGVVRPGCGIPSRATAVADFSRNSLTRLAFRRVVANVRANNETMRIKVQQGASLRRRVTSCWGIGHRGPLSGYVYYSDRPNLVR